MTNGVWHKHPYYPSELAIELCVVFARHETHASFGCQVYLMESSLLCPTSPLWQIEGGTEVDPKL